MIDARRTELLTIRIEHGARTAPSDLISALQTIPDGWVISDISSFDLADWQQVEIRIEPDERTA
nr:MAG TPA: Vacuolar sorting protein 39 domain 2 [Caudoviricetes sp.]